MATKKFTIPFRGKVKRVRADGHVIADGQIQPVDLMAFTHDNPVIPDPSSEKITFSCDNYDYGAETVDVTVTCDDQVFLDALETFTGNTPDLRAAEITIAIANETNAEQPEKSQAAAHRQNLEAGLSIKTADLNRWKKSHGR